jgi:glycosyltransferase involved in cell wall biosynthesis
MSSDRYQQMKPQLLITIYANPDYYPPTLYAVRILSCYFAVHILCRNMDQPIVNWPRDVTIERIGEYAPPRDKEAASALAKLREYSQFVARTRSLIKRMHPAIVYCYDPYAFVASQVGRRTRVGSTPVIFHLHELPETQSPSWSSLEGWVVRAALRGTKSAGALICPERYRARQWLRDAGDSRGAIIVPNCPDKSYIAAPWDWDDTIDRRFSNRQVVYVGYASADNGHLEGLRALAMTQCGTQMRVIGGYKADFGESFNALARELGVAERVSLDGWLQQDQVLARASAAGAGLSLHKPVAKGLEYLGSASNKLFEYAAMGLPVIVPDRASYRDFLGNADWAIYTDIEKPESIAHAIDSIFADRERYAAMSRAARRAFEEHYNYERVFAPALARVFELSGITTRAQSTARDLAQAS